MWAPVHEAHTVLLPTKRTRTEAGLVSSKEFINSKPSFSVAKPFRRCDKYHFAKPGITLFCQDINVVEVEVVGGIKETELEIGSRVIRRGQADEYAGIPNR